MGRGELVELPSAGPAAQLRKRLQAHGSWFYRFAFDNGVVTEPIDPVAQQVHDTRARLVFPLLDEIVGEGWADTECVDLACHEGWFSTQLAARGAANVLGLDLRPEHVERARAIQQLAGLPNLRFDVRDLYGLDADEIGTFDVVLFLGVLYHLDDPMGALRVVRSLTRRVCVLETQVAQPTAELQALWGSGAARSGPGIAVVPSDDRHVQGGHAVVLVPTLSALFAMLHAVGFRHVHLAAARPDEFPQFATGDRVVVFAMP